MVRVSLTPSMPRAGLRHLFYCGGRGGSLPLCHSWLCVMRWGGGDTRDLSRADDCLVARRENVFKSDQPHCLTVTREGADVP